MHHPQQTDKYLFLLVLDLVLLKINNCKQRINKIYATKK